MIGKFVILSVGLMAILSAHNGAKAISVEEAKDLAKMFSEPCKVKYRIPNGLIEEVNKGVFPDNRTLKCYTNCILEMTQTVSRGRIDYRMSLTQIDLFFPDEMKEPAKKTLEACRGSMKGFKDYCEASYNYLQCMYRVNSQYFYFP